MTTRRMVHLSGETFQIRGPLKNDDWKWNADEKRWEQMINDQWDEEMIKRHLHSLSGIRNRLGNVIVTFPEAANCAAE